MKIMQIIPSLEVGGAETMCEGLSEMLKQQGQTVTVVSLYRLGTPVSQRLQAAGIRLVFLDKKPGLDLLCIPRLRKLIRAEKPDVIHVHLYALKYAGIAAMGMKIPMVQTIHNVASYDAEHDKSINQMLYKSGRVTPVSLSREIQKTVTEFYGLSESETPVIYNGIDLNRCIPKEDYALRQPPEIIHVGRFWEQKNHACMIHAVKLLKEQGQPVKLRFFGDGPLMEQTKQLAAEQGVTDCLEFCGVSDRIFPHLNHADLFILPSKWEGMPMTIIEAMGTGLPVIASDVGGVADMISPEHNGILISPDAARLAEAITRLLDRAELRARLGENAKIEAIRFSGQTMAKRYLSLYRELSGKE